MSEARRRASIPGGTPAINRPRNGNDGQRIFEREDVGKACRDIFAHAVANHGLRSNAVRHPPLRERILQ